MELSEVMRTTGAVRQFTDEPLPDYILERILDDARFAPSGGNRQGVHVTAIDGKPSPNSAGPAPAVTSRNRTTVKSPGTLAAHGGIGGSADSYPGTR